MYCKHCGKQIADDSTFCQFCGGKLDNSSTGLKDTPCDNSFDREYIKKGVKKIEVSRLLFSYMMDFIRTEYGDISVTQDDINTSMLSPALANARIAYEDNEYLISICVENGLDYNQILEEVSEKIIDHFLNPEQSEANDLPF